MGKEILIVFYEQFEEFNKKLDKLIVENKNQSVTIYNQNLTIEKLTKELEKSQIYDFCQDIVTKNSKVK